MGAHVLNALGLCGRYTLVLNSLGDEETRSHFRQKLVDYLTPLSTQLSEESQARLLKNPLRILDSNDIKDQALLRDAPKLHDYWSPQVHDFHATLLQYLDGLNISYVNDPHLVRGLDYYTHTAFEIKFDHSESAQNTILAGGRYDGLSEQLGGPRLPAIGWAMGIDRLNALIEEMSLKSNHIKIGVISIGDAPMIFCLQLSNRLRQEFECRNSSLVVEVFSHHNLTKAFKQADKNGCHMVILVGEDELAAQTLRIKHFHDCLQPEFTKHDQTKQGDMLLSNELLNDQTIKQDEVLNYVGKFINYIREIDNRFSRNHFM